MSPFEETFKAYRTRIEAGFTRWIPAAGTRPARLHEAMRYSLEAGGKRLRPVLVLAGEALWPAERDPVPAAVAVECVHTYSLIHDDLPAMDNSDLRRGRPTCHKAFDEATAILAGDALLTHAFGLLATAYEGDLGAALVAELARVGGSEQLIGGQMADIEAEAGAVALDEEGLAYIHAHKTAALLGGALAMGARVGGADETHVEAARRVGLLTGHAFQLIDDWLDATADAETLGKDSGQDARNEKVTAVQVYGMEGTRERAAAYTRKARTAAGELPGANGEAATFLDRLIAQMGERLA